MVVVFDLDDTLYNEIDFVKSGFQEVSSYLQNKSYYEFMLEVFNKEGSGKVFNKLVERFHIDIPISKLIEVYRFHTPAINLPKESIDLLEFSKKYQTALISDGHYIMQQNKFYTLGLHRYIEYPLFTDFYHTKKPNIKPYQMVMDHFKNERKFIYISDNPKKDFVAVDKLKWIGIRYKNQVGIYRDLKNNTTFEVSDRQGIIEILKELENE